MTDNTSNDTPTPEENNNPSNRPDLYIQKRTWVNGKTVYKKLGVTWDKTHYSSGPSEDGRSQIVVHTRDQWDALQEMRKERQAKQHAPAQEVNESTPTQTPSV
ncbi:MAG: hypothetical protein ABJH28_05145 [Paraglaciecola sp.]|uniref:hypothetical protein n=1 Tax=Paraglaciecola sp. TaxID=1920173 RepID=UPI00326435D6